MKKVLDYVGGLLAMIVMFAIILLVGCTREKSTHEKSVYVSPYAIESDSIEETKSETTYPRALVVDYNDIENGVVYFNDKVANEWLFEIETDLESGDTVGAIFSDNGTPEYIYDDYIVDFRYSF